MLHRHRAIIWYAFGVDQLNSRGHVFVARFSKSRYKFLIYQFNWSDVTIVIIIIIIIIIIKNIYCAVFMTR